MRTIQFNGVIDTESWWGDEMTPQMLHDQLYESPDSKDDVTIKMYSYGGNCDAATLMFDDIRNYPGHVTVDVQIAVSAATVVTSAADTIRMSPVGMYMIHRPSTFACGNVDDFQSAISELNVCMNSIVNGYEKRCAGRGVSREDIIKMMVDTTWMDANTALAKGFIDEISEAIPKVVNSATGRVIDQKAVEERLDAWVKRDTARRMREALGEDKGKKNTVPAAQLQKRLSLIRPNN